MRLTTANTRRSTQDIVVQELFLHENPASQLLLYMSLRFMQQWQHWELLLAHFAK